MCDPVSIASDIVVTGLEDASRIALSDISYSMDDIDGSEKQLAFLF